MFTNSFFVGFNPYVFPIFIWNQPLFLPYRGTTLVTIKTNMHTLAQPELRVIATDVPYFLFIHNIDYALSIELDTNTLALQRTLPSLPTRISLAIDTTRYRYHSHPCLTQSFHTCWFGNDLFM